MSLFISTLALLTACLSALYARWSVHQARRANDIGRLNALFGMKNHYHDLLEHLFKLANNLQSSFKGMKVVRDRVAELDSKLREMDEQISFYHDKVVKNKMY